MRYTYKMNLNELNSPIFRIDAEEYDSKVIICKEAPNPKQNPAYRLQAGERCPEMECILEQILTGDNNTYYRFIDRVSVYAEEVSFRICECFNGRNWKTFVWKPLDDSPYSFTFNIINETTATKQVMYKYSFSFSNKRLRNYSEFDSEGDGIANRLLYPTESNIVCDSIETKIL